MVISTMVTNATLSRNVMTGWIECYHTTDPYYRVYEPTRLILSRIKPRIIFSEGSPSQNSRVFAIYQIMLGWETYKYYYETDELPNPRPTQPKKKRLKVAFGPLFPTVNKFWLGLVLHRKQTTRNLTQPNSPQTL